ncbi:5-methylcytosine-specific restriction endonuclease McrA [Lachnospiraceae bacterium PF1-22]
MNQQNTEQISRNQYIVKCKTSFRARYIDKYLIKRGLLDNKRPVPKRNSVTYTITASGKEIKKLTGFLILLLVSFTCYESIYERSSNYRNEFFKHTTPPYRCRYCNKVLSEQEVTVDHLIPVKQAKVSSRARKQLKAKGCDSVNDIKNLVPSCARCNSKKGQKMGLWVIRGELGKYKGYWYLHYSCNFLVIFTLVFLCFALMTRDTNNIYSVIEKNISNFFIDLFGFLGNIMKGALGK